MVSEPENKMGKKRNRVSDEKETESEINGSNQNENTLYRVLGVERTAIQQFGLHPDKNPGEEGGAEESRDGSARSTAEFQQSRNVVSILGDEEKRALYDQTGCVVDHGNLAGDALQKLQEHFRMLCSDPELGRFKNIIDEAIASADLKEKIGLQRMGKENVRNQSQRYGGTARVNAVQRSGTWSGLSNPEVENSGLTGLTNEQWETLKTLLNSQTTSSNAKMTGDWNTTSWIIDTGASNHMTGDLNSMCDLHNIQSCPVGLPDGQHAMSTREGTVILDGGLKLTNVLYVPRLNCSLISVSQLSNDLDCIVQFTNKLCVMQDRTSRILIGAGERKDGLYYFRGIRRARAYKADGIKSMDLWHKRIGHPSMKITKLIPGAGKCEGSGIKSCYSNYFVRCSSAAHI